MRITALPKVRDTVASLADLAVEALVEDCGLTPPNAKARLNAELDYYRDLDLASHSLPDIYRRFTLSLANRGLLSNLVYGTEWSGEPRLFDEILCGYEPAAMAAKWAGRAGALRDALLSARRLSDTQAAHQRSSDRTGFSLYARGLIAGAEYFQPFEDGSAFARFVERWLTDPDVAQMLPEYFAAQRIPGFGSALAADFLKEIGVKQLGKPDRWVLRVMQAAGWISEGASGFAVQRALWAAWAELGDRYEPVIIDKLMFLVGSGDFGMVDPRYRCRSRLDAFAERVAASTAQSARESASPPSREPEP